MAKLAVTLRFQSLCYEHPFALALYLRCDILISLMAKTNKCFFNKLFPIPKEKIYCQPILFISYNNIFGTAFGISPITFQMAVMSDLKNNVFIND